MQQLSTHLFHLLKPWSKGFHRAGNLPVCSHLLVWSLCFLHVNQGDWHSSTYLNRPQPAGECGQCWLPGCRAVITGQGCEPACWDKPALWQPHPAAHAKRRDHSIQSFRERESRERRRTPLRRGVRIILQSEVNKTLNPGRASQSLHSLWWILKTHFL